MEVVIIVQCDSGTVVVLRNVDVLQQNVYFQELSVVAYRPRDMWIKVLNELHKIKNVILINSRIPADKTLVSTDKSYKLVGISQKKKMF